MTEQFYRTQDTSKASKPIKGYNALSGISNRNVLFGSSVNNLYQSKLSTSSTTTAIIEPASVPVMQKMEPITEQAQGPQVGGKRRKRRGRGHNRYVSFVPAVEPSDERRNRYF